MKSHIISGILILSVFTGGCTITEPPVSVDSTVFFVATNGCDSNSGTFDQPFATLEKARDSIRQIKDTRIFPCGGVTVYLRGGIYRREKSFVLNGYDGGLENNRIVYRAYRDEQVRLIGGRAISPSSIKKVTDPEILGRLVDPAAKDHLYYVDLKEQGVDDYGQVIPDPNCKTELFLKNQYLPLARYPNEGWLEIADVPQQGEKLINEGRKEWLVHGIPRGRHYGRFRYAEDRPNLWSDQNEIYAHGYWVYDWSDQVIRIDKIDKANHDVYPRPPHHHYGYQEESRYYFLNILDEIDCPGEWCIDRNEGILYLWPPCQIAEGELIFPTLAEPMIQLQQVSYVTIRGLSFEASRSEGVNISGGSNNRIAGCCFVNLGNTAVMIKEGVNHSVQSCDIHDIAGAGIDMTGGDRKTLQPGGHVAENNHIHHYACVIRCYQPAIRLNGVGLRASNNNIHDAPHEGLEFGGNDLVMEYNDFARLCQETGDVGAIYTAQDWSFAGTVIRYNYFHNIHGSGRYVDAKGVYLDLPVGGTIVHGNVFYDLDSGFFTNSGRGILIENNLFVNCNHSFQFNVYREPSHFVLGGPWKLVEKLNDVNYTQPPYSVRYPWLPGVLAEGDDPAIGGHNIVRKNICFGRGEFILHEELDFDRVQVRDNLITTEDICHWRKDFDDPTKGAGTYQPHDKKMVNLLEDYGNIILNSDPGLENVENEDFRLTNDSPAHQIGFKPIPFDKIGLYPNEFRKTVTNPSF